MICFLYNPTTCPPVYVGSVTNWLTVICRNMLKRPEIFARPVSVIMSNGSRAKIPRRFTRPIGPANISNAWVVKSLFSGTPEYLRGPSPSLPHS